MSKLDDILKQKSVDRLEKYVEILKDLADEYEDLIDDAKTLTDKNDKQTSSVNKLKNATDHLVNNERKIIKINNTYDKTLVDIRRESNKLADVNDRLIRSNNSVASATRNANNRQKEHNRTLNNSKSNVKSLTSELGNYAKGFVGVTVALTAFKKLATSAFDSAMEVSQEFNDSISTTKLAIESLWNKTIKGVIDANNSDLNSFNKKFARVVLGIVSLGFTELAIKVKEVGEADAKAYTKRYNAFRIFEAKQKGVIGDMLSDVEEYRKIANDTSYSIEERYEAMTKAISLRNEVVKLETKLVNGRISIEQEYADLLAINKKDNVDYIVKIQELQNKLSEFTKSAASQTKEMIAKRNTLFKEMIDEEYVNGIVDGFDNYFNALDNSHDGLMKRTEARIYKFKALAAIAGTTNTKYKDIIKQSYKDLRSNTLSKAFDEDNLKNFEEEYNKYLDRMAEKRLHKENAILTAAFAMNQEFFQGLSNLAGENAKQQAAIAYSSAIFNATLNAYLAVMSVLAYSKGGLITKLAAGATIAAYAFGLLGQIKAINNNVNAYADGTDSSSNDFIAGEKGRELVFTNDGAAYLATTPTLFSDAVGSKVLTNAKTEAMLRNRSINNMDKSHDTTANAVASVSIDKFGIFNINKKYQDRRNYINVKIKN